MRRLRSCPRLTARRVLLAFILLGAFVGPATARTGEAAQDPVPALDPVAATESILAQVPAEKKQRSDA